MIKVGLGFDSHKLVEGRKLIVGGIEIPFTKGEEGHSDADALTHAIIDSLLGAAGLGDIGSYFPPDDDKWLNADSINLLKIVLKDIYKQGWKIENIDCVLKLEKPKFLPFRKQIIENLAKAMNISSDCVFVKAKTGEGLGPVGEGLCIEAIASCLLSKESNNTKKEAPFKEEASISESDLSDSDWL